MNTADKVELLLKFTDAVGRAEECAKSYRFFFTLILASYVLAWEMLQLGLGLKPILLTLLALQAVGLLYQELARRRLDTAAEKLVLAVATCVEPANSEEQ